VDTAYEAAEEYGIRSVPTVVIVKDGVEINRFTGMSSKLAYVNAINEGLK
jgi:thioredoxin-like negative regulator of GroEL